MLETIGERKGKMDLGGWVESSDTDTPQVKDRESIPIHQVKGGSRETQNGKKE